MIWSLLVPGILNNGLVSHVTDNHIKSTIAEPAVGSVLYCDLLFGLAEHSGVYMGNGEIMHLNKHGIIELVTPQSFIQNTTAMSIYTSCQGHMPAGSHQVADNAAFYNRSIQRRKYNVLLDNCHQFSAACLSGDPDNSVNFLWMLKDAARDRLNADTWRVWKY